ncbi:MAG: hypothetical protein JXA77_10450 [Bacteroidales bacterium]|nr:hypothetical protein [Bacteroidales bacterium]
MINCLLKISALSANRHSAFKKSKSIRLKRPLFTFFAACLLSLSLSGQDCTGYHQYHCTYADYTYFYSRQSKSALFSPGQEGEMHFIAYADEEYYVSICAHKKMGDIQFKIFEDSPERNLIYDNSSDGFSPSVVFRNERTRNLIIEVKIPDKGNDKERRCVGVLIEFKKTNE